MIWFGLYPYPTATKYNYINMKHKIFPIILYLAIFVQPLFSQSIYELHYRSPNNPTLPNIHAFLVKLGDGEGFVRLSYFDSLQNQHTIIQLDVQEDFLQKENGEPDANTLIIQTLNPKTILPATEITYHPDKYIFKKDPATGYFEPWKVNGIAIDQPVDFLSVPRLLVRKDMSKTLLANYFKTDEAAYQNYAQPQARSGGLLLGKNMPKMFLMIVSNIRDESIGPDCLKDQQNLVKTYAAIADELEINMDTIIIQGDQYSKKNVLDAINDLKPGKNDIVIFHYSGHGYNSDKPKDSFPNMVINADTLPVSDLSKLKTVLPTVSINIEDIYKMIIAKNARLNFVFSDCCNTTINFDQKQDPLIPVKRDAWDVTANKCKMLFLDQRVNVLATATKKGQESKGNETNGGYFTYNYVENLRSLLSPFNAAGKDISWSSLLDKTSAATSYRALHHCYDKALKSPCVMDPVVRITSPAAGK